MNAVNLIPGQSGKRKAGLTLGPQAIGLIGGLALVLIAVFLYVSAANKVSARKSELAQVSTGVAQWTAAGSSYASFVKAAQQHTKALADVRQLAASRFPWSQLLGQIGGLMPRKAALSSLQAATASPTGSTPAAQLTGCASSQATVAQTMVALHQVKGVTAVTLASTSDSGAGTASGSSASGSGGCTFPVQFQISLTFGAAAAPTNSTATTSTATGAASTGTASTASTPSTTTTAGAQ